MTGSAPNFALLAIGGAHPDRIGRMADGAVKGASNPGVMSEHVGGGAFNALRAARLRGVSPCCLMSVRGGDMAAASVEAAIADAEITDASGVFLTRRTPSYTALLDPDGQVEAALSDMALYDEGFVRIRARLGKQLAAYSGALLVDANVPAPALATIFAVASPKFSFAIAVSPAKVIRLRDIAERIDWLFLNRREATALTGETMSEAHAAALFAAGFKGFVLTDGAATVELGHGGQVLRLAVPALGAMVDATGCGDALAGAFVASLLSGIEPREAALSGIAAAQLTAHVSGPVCPLLGAPQYATTLAAVRSANTEHA